MSKTLLRKTLSAPGLLRLVRGRFERINDPVSGRGLTLADCLMSALAMFGLKYPSLLSFERDARREGRIRSNLRSLYGVGRAPSDTAMRERLDAVDPAELRGAFKAVLSALQRGKGLDGFAWLDGHYLLSVDGTGHFSSKSVNCDHCCVKEHKDGTKTYYHQMLGAAIVHPDFREVFALPPEPIMRSDGDTKNDCERNAAKRLLRDVRREHPHLKLMVVEDGLASNGPHVRLLQELNMRFVLGAKPGDHADLFETVDASPMTRALATKGRDGTRHRCRFINGVPLNDANRDLEVNFLEWTETKPNGKVQRFSWVTDVVVDETNAESLMRAGRARWRIENETFNTLKNQGYGFEHNYGHGKRHLATAFAMLAMLAFLIDQVQQRCCALFRAARKRAGRTKYLWERLRGLFLELLVPDWETLYRAIAFGHRTELVPFDTS